MGYEMSCQQHSQPVLSQEEAPWCFKDSSLPCPAEPALKPIIRRHCI